MKLTIEKHPDISRLTHCFQKIEALAKEILRRVLAEEDVSELRSWIIETVTRMGGDESRKFMLIRKKNNILSISFVSNISFIFALKIMHKKYGNNK